MDHGIFVYYLYEVHRVNRSYNAESDIHYVDILNSPYNNRAIEQIELYSRSSLNI